MCIWIFHKWGKWSKPRNNSEGNGLQDRYCEKCGKYQVRWLG